MKKVLLSLAALATIVGAASASDNLVSKICDSKSGKMTGCGVEISYIFQNRDDSSYTNVTSPIAAIGGLVARETATADEKAGASALITATYTDVLKDDLLWEGRFGFGKGGFEEIMLKPGARVHMTIDDSSTFYIGSFVNIGIGGSRTINTAVAVTDDVNPPLLEYTGTEKINFDSSLGIGGELGYKKFNAFNVDNLTISLGFEFVSTETKGSVKHTSDGTALGDAVTEYLDSDNKYDASDMEANVMLSVGYKF